MRVDVPRKEKKMGSIRRRDVAIRAAAMVMLEQGKVLSKREFDMVPERTAIRSGNLMNLFGSWSRLVGFIEKDHPDIWAQLQGEPAPVEEAPEEHTDECPCDACECDPCECVEEASSEPDPLAALAKASEPKEDDE